MSRVSNGQNNGRQAGRFGEEESAGDGLEGCAGGEDVINHQHALALDELWFAQGECAPDVGMAGFLRGLSGLLFGVADADQRLNEREVCVFVQPRCDQPGLIVSPRKLAAAVKWDRHDHINMLEERRDAGLLEEAIGEPLGQGPFSVVFELVDDGLDRLIEDTQPADALVGVQTFAQTSRARRIGLSDRHGAVNARGGDGKVVKF